MNVITVYVGEKSLNNLMHGIKNHIWGFKEKVIGNLKNFNNEDTYIMLGTGYTGGSPRTAFENWINYKLEKIYIAKVRNKFYRNAEAEWDDEKYLISEDRYVWRVNFLEVSILKDLELKALPKELAEGFRSSGIAQSRGYLIENIDISDLLSAAHLYDEKPENKDISIKQEQKIEMKGPFQKIIYGAPGTGKSYRLKQETEKTFKDIQLKDKVIIAGKERVTFYDGYTYGQFVGSYKPVPNGERDITYKYVPGPFMTSLVKALNYPDYGFALVIEEINRAKADRVFGNIFQLLDRNPEGDSRYPIAISEEQESYLRENLGNDFYENNLKNGLYLPKNFYIWSTMNNADQGIYPLDTAFKRRWKFEYIGLDDNEDSFGENGLRYMLDIEHSKEESNDILYIDKAIDWKIYRKALNNFLLENGINEDRLIAPFFIEDSDFQEDTEADEKNKYFNYRWIDKDIYLNKLIMYLFEDVLKHKITLRKRLFKEELNSFSKLVKEYNSGENIYSDEFIARLSNNIENIEYSETEE